MSGKFSIPGHGMRLPVSRLAFIVVVAFSAASLLAQGAAGDAEEPASPDGSGQLSAAEIEARIEQLESSESVEPAVKQQALALYQSALADQRAAADWRARAAEAGELQKGGDELVRQAEDDLAALPSESQVDPPNTADQAQLLRELRRHEAELTAAETQLEAAETELQGRTARRAALPALIAQAEERLEQARESLESTNAEDSPDVAAARTTARQARRELASGELAALQGELASFDIRSELLPLERDLAARRVALANARIKMWKAQLARRQIAEVEQQVADVRRRMEKASALLRPAAMKAVALAEDRRDTLEKLAAARAESDEVRASLREVKERFAQVKTKVDTVGLNDALGLLLRRERTTLPNVERHRRARSLREAEIRSVQLDLMDLEERRRELLGSGDRARQDVAELAPAATSARRARLGEELRSILELESEVVRQLIADKTDLFQELVDLDTDEQRLIASATEYRDYIDERILWVQSAPVISLWDVLEAGPIAAALLEGEGWSSVGEQMAADVRQFPLLWIAAGLGLIAAGAAYPLLRRRIALLGEEAGRRACRTVTPTLWAGLWTLVLAVLPVGILLFLSWRLSAPPDAIPLAGALAAALSISAFVLLPAELLRQFVRRGGLAEAHFQWPAATRRAISLHLRWVMSIGLPLAFLGVLILAFDNPRWESTVGRLIFIAGMLLSAAFLHALLRPWGTPFRAVIAERQEGWIARFRYAWYLAAIAAPLALAVLAGAGYQYTAVRLATRLQTTVWLTMGVVLFGSLLYRWLRINRTRLAMEQARQRRAALAEAENEASEIPDVPTAEEQAAELSTIDGQTRRLVNIALLSLGLLGAWVVWSDVLPALGIFNSVTLWNTAEQVSESVTAPDGTVTTQAVEKIRPVTLANLLVALLAGLLTLVAARNLPGLLEFAVRERAPEPFLTACVG